MIYRLAGDNNTSTWKNSLIGDNKDKKIGIVQDNYFDEFDAIVSEHNEEYSLILMVGGYAKECGEMNFEEVLQSFDMEIIGLHFNTDLLAKTGCYNEELSKLTDYELLLRLVKEEGKCFCQIIELDELDYLNDKFDTKSSAETYAYILAKYSKDLQERGLFDQLFQNIFILMNNWGLENEFKSLLIEFMGNSKRYRKILSDTSPYLIILGDNTCVGVLKDFAISLGKSLEKLGQAVCYVENQISLTESYKGCIGFQSVAQFDVAIRNLEIPKYAFWLDNPLMAKDLLYNLPDDYYLLCQDSDYADNARKLLHVRNSIQFPPAGCELEEGIPFPYKERPLDIVFIGSYLYYKFELDEYYKKYFDYMISNSDLSYDEGLRKYHMESYGQEKTHEEIIDTLKKSPEVRQAIAGFYRHKIIETILDAGYQIHVYGNSWKQYEGKGASNLVIHDEISPRDAIEVMSHAKIGLNIMRWHKAGMTERVANIMLAGAVCLSDETKYLVNNFTDGENIAMFNLDEIDSLPSRIYKILSDDRYRMTLASNGYEKAKEEHTWDVRAKAIIRMQDKLCQMV